MDIVVIEAILKKQMDTYVSLRDKVASYAPSGDLSRTELGSVLVSLLSEINTLEAIMAPLKHTSVEWQALAQRKLNLFKRASDMKRQVRQYTTLQSEEHRAALVQLNECRVLLRAMFYTDYFAPGKMITEQEQRSVYHVLSKYAVRFEQLQRTTFKSTK